MINPLNHKDDNSRFQSSDGFRTVAHFLNLLAILLGLLALVSVMKAQPVVTARNQALAKRVLAVNAAFNTRANYVAAEPGHTANIANERARGTNAWNDLQTKDPSAPNYGTAMDFLMQAAMDLDQAEMMLASIPDILDTGDRYISLGDAKMTQGDANFGVGNFRVAIYCYWAAKDWYRQAITIFGRAQNRLNEVGALITSAQNNLTNAEAIIAGLPAMPVMPPPMGGGGILGGAGGAGGGMGGAGMLIPPVGTSGSGPMGSPDPLMGMPSL